ncbi:MAG: cytochrome c biogenesis protein CcdA [Candidatus Altiarchaeota archaeon]
MNPELLVSTVLAGLFAAFSPCSIPAYPVLLNILAAEGRDRRQAAIAFSVGVASTFTVFYVAVGFALKWLGDAFSETLNTVYVVLYLAAAVLCFLFALQSLGKITFFTRTFGLHTTPRGGVFGSFLTGALFATIVSPCNLGFLLIGVLPVLLSKATVLEGLLLMLLFSVSLSLPMLTLGLLSSHAMDKWLRGYVGLIEKTSAGFLILAGLYFIYIGFVTYLSSG